MAQRALRMNKDVTLCLLKDYIHGACSMDLPVVGIGAYRDGTDKIIAEMDLLFTQFNSEVPTKKKEEKIEIR